MPTRAVKNLNYIVNADSSVEFDSPVYNLELPVTAINYQLLWEAGVKGKFTWKASIIPTMWETLVSCEEVSYTVDGSEEHTIISLPNAWLNSEFLKFTWVPDVGSTGAIDAAIRVVPI